MILLDDRTDPLAALDSDPRVHLSATGSWLNAEPGGEDR